MITANNITYKDDFIDNNVEDKNYLRILFNGGRSVQIRELNQLQSILQSQIDKFGSSIYKQGAAVIGGGCSFERKINAISFGNNPLNSAGIVADDIIQLIQGSGSTTIVADVIGREVLEDTTTFYIKYASGGGEASDGSFNTLSPISLQASGAGVSGSFTPTGTSDVAGAFLSEGVFFVNGSFVVTPKQDLFIPVEDVDGITGSIVLNVTESIVTYTSDQTLLDNADGTPNHLAPGADRYQITLSLAFLSGDAATDTINRVTLLNIVDSNIVISSKSRYSDIDRQLAQRTSEESGDYVINPFTIEVKDLVGSLRPGSEDEDAQDRVYIGLDPSVAYVDGYRIELGQKLDLTAPRARTLQEKRVSLSLNFGNYVDVSLTSGTAIPLPNTVNLTYELKNLADATIGTCRIKSVESVGALFRVFLYDINLSGAYNLADIDRIINTTGGIDMKVESAVSDTANDTGVFPLPYQNVKSIAVVSPEDFSYVIKKIYTGVIAAGGEFTINTGANETFEDANISDFIVEVDGDWLSVNDILLFASAPSSITIKSNGAAWTPGDAIKVIFPVKIESNTPATKSLTTITNEVIAPAGNVYILSKSDIFDVVSVVIDGSTSDITSDIEISSDGQKTSHYTNGELRYIGTGSAPTIKVTYRHFAHSGLPFTINSYPINWDENDTLASDEIRYADLPSFEDYSLGDVIDFRPTILAGAGTTTAIQPDPNSALTCKPTFFLPRYDKVIVNANGEFVIVQGVPDLMPSPPATPPASLALYELQYPAYTYKASDVVIRLIDNRRYTMRDIAKLDKRISNLEYYTSLSLLEASANEKSIFDNVQGQRFKNGMLIDAFTGHGIGNVLSDAYRCSVDRKERIVRPFFLTDAVDLAINPGTGLNVSINENTVTKSFTETPLISQLVSSESESVNPYDVATFIGNVKLFPTNDKWIETSRRPDIIINDDSAFDAFRLTANESGILGTEWNSWRTDWVGVSVNVSPPHSVRAPDGVMRQAVVTTGFINQSRDRIVTSLESTISRKNLGDRVVDVSFVPFIRSRRVYFQAKGLKPLTRVYPFFDGISIESYCATTDSVISQANLDQVREFFGQKPGDSGFIVSDSLVSDASGELIGSFIIPNNDVLKFRVGERIFKLTDSSTNNTEEETTFAEGIYNAAGTLQTVESTILSTRVPVLKRDRVVETRVLVDPRVSWQDPLAQTFIIDGISEGAFVTSLDLWFTSKSTSSIPVSVRIVAVDNGYPTQRVIPFSEVTLRADDVNIWTNDPETTEGSTNFAFSDPVYLKGGVEYAIVVLSNDPDYRIRVARLGGAGEDGKIIQQNPYGGVMFMSQNASTWTADQTRDMKFVLNRAVFDVNSVSSIDFKTIMREGVASITVTEPGTNYVGATVTIDEPIPDFGGSPGVRATAEPIIDLVSGTIKAIRITNPGYGYVGNPNPGVTITRVPAGSGTEATATANMYAAPTSAFSLIQGALVQKECELVNTLTFGAVSYASIESGETYLPENEFTITQLSRATISSQLSTSSQYLSPVIDLDSMNILCIHNQVNSLTSDDVSETLADGGNALSRYITREADLNDPADQLNIYLDVNRPTEGTNILMFVKLKYDSETYSDWLSVAPQVKIPITDDRAQYNEVTYILNSADNDFISFAVKLVFVSDSTVTVASAKNLRIIATS